MLPGPEARPVDDIEFYRLIRSRLEHEDGLIVNRLSWLVASQAFLFTAYGIAQNGLMGGGRTASAIFLLLKLLPWVGIASASLIYVGLFAAMRAMAWLRATFRERVIDETRLGLPPITTPNRLRLWGLAAPAVLPIVFLLVWITLLLRATPT